MPHAVVQWVKVPVTTLGSPVLPVQVLVTPGPLLVPPGKPWVIAQVCDPTPLWETYMAFLTPGFSLPTVTTSEMNQQLEDLSFPFSLALCFSNKQIFLKQMPDAVYGQGVSYSELWNYEQIYTLSRVCTPFLLHSLSLISSTCWSSSKVGLFYGCSNSLA